MNSGSKALVWQRMTHPSGLPDWRGTTRSYILVWFARWVQERLSMKWELLRHRLTDSCLLHLASLSTSRIVSTPQIVGGLVLTGAMRRPETFTKCFAKSPTWISFVLASGRVLGVSEIWGRGNGACFRFCLGLCWRQFVIVKSGIRPRLAGGSTGSSKDCHVL